MNAQTGTTDESGASDETRAGPLRVTTHDDGLVEVLLDAPPANEIGMPMLEALESFLDGLDLDRTRAVVIGSARESGFSAGADLRQLHVEMTERPESEHEAGIRAFLTRIHAAFTRLDTLPVVTVAAIHGVCFGGGFELALTCDLRVVEKTARFGFPELRLGLIPGFGGIPRLRREVGEGVVRDLLMTGRSLNAKRAVALGLASQMVMPGEGLAVARRMAGQAAKYDPEATRTAKRFIKRVPTEELAREIDEFVRLAGGEAVRKALAEFVGRTDAFPYVV